MKDCKTCGAYFVYADHRCPPVWLIWCEEDGTEEEDADEVYAHSAVAAVEKWAEEYDPHNDYTIVQGHETTVCVRGAGGELLKVAVTGESVPTYSARTVG